MDAWRIGLFTEVYRPIQNGIVASVDALARALREQGHDAAIVTPRVPRFRDLDGSVVRVPSLPLPTPTAYRLTVPYLPRAIGALALVHAQSPFLTGALGAVYARRARVPLVFTYHTQLEAYAHYVPLDARLARAAASRLTRAYANAADAVVVPTVAMERRLRALGVRVPIVVVPSGIDVAAFANGRRRDDLRARFGVAAHETLVLAVGRLAREKNLELALAGFARADLYAARFVLVGDGPHRPALERAACRLGIADRTVFAREFARDALPDAYASADVFLFTSRTETQGLVLAEALAAGLPVVAVDTPQTREVLGEAGLLVAPEPAALARGLRAALAGGAAAGQLARSAAWAFDGVQQGRRIIALYAALLEGSRLTSNVRSM